MFARSHKVRILDYEVKIRVVTISVVGNDISLAKARSTKYQGFINRSQVKKIDVLGII